jgi:hypothetical protein
MSKKHSFHMYINNALFDMNNVDSEITSILKDIMGGFNEEYHNYSAGLSFDSLSQAIAKDINRLNEKIKRLKSCHVIPIDIKKR